MYCDAEEPEKLLALTELLRIATELAVLTVAPAPKIIRILVELSKERKFFAPKRALTFQTPRILLHGNAPMNPPRLVDELKVRVIEFSKLSKSAERSFGGSTKS